MATMVPAERTRHLDALRDCFEACASGGGSRVVVVSGPVGSGKTALVHTFVETQVGSGTPVLSATGSAGERSRPLGVIGQLFGSVGRRSGFELVAATPDMDDVCSLLSDVVDDEPALLCVDDIHHADDRSLETLLYLHRRLRGTRVLIVLTAPGLPYTGNTVFDVELGRHLPVRHLPLEMLTTAGIAELLGEPAGCPLVADYADLSGGNPLLVTALLGERRPGDGGTGPGPSRPGPGFAAAVSACLHRVPAPALQAARGLAVLGPTWPHLLADVAGLSQEALDRALGTLAEVRLLRDGGTFRHPVIRDAALTSLAEADRAATHLRAASALRREGLDAAAIAGHLIEAEALVEPGSWPAEVFAGAAGDVLHDDRPELAIRYAEAALRATGDQRVRSAAFATLTRAQWQINPSAAGSHLPELRTAFRAGHLSAEDTRVLLNVLSWNGRTAEVRDTLDRIADAGDAADPRLSGTLASVRSWSRHFAPAESRPACSPDGAGNPAAADSVLEDFEHQGVDVALLLSTLLTLIHADRLAAAQAWCDRLLARFAGREQLLLRAVLTGVTADIALRRGDLPEARNRAAEALGLMCPGSWGVVLGYPLGTHVLASVALREFGEADALLRRRTKPEMLDTTFGLGYRHARGHHALATGRPHAALQDFLTCGELAGEWDVDHPALAAWRTGAGQAYLALGRTSEALAMFDDEIAHARGKASSVHAAALRLTGHAAPEADRLALLQQSVSLLQGSEHLLELATALAELSNEYYERGDSKRSRTTGRRAMEVAQRCEATGITRDLLLSGDRFDLTGLLEPDEDPHRELTAREAGVARLAADGLSNKAIGQKLFLSVSTVEQHLTKVFRKLDISRRADLIGILGQRQSGKSGSR
ncbi:helix-turn-helix transcriptional regulator [Amycolatopsis sp. NBC_00438]|uniref:helix-turn-helix transcriptional regulator n=1 Tax=Amycolatopsis sp. NBC_00438 TaxID=2903558 RepID=UPI002E235A14